MKVLLLTDHMDAGGAETHIAHLALGLQAAGVDVTLASCGGRLARALEKQGIPQRVLGLSGRNPLLLLAARRALRRMVIKEGFEILHAHARIPALLLRGSHR